MGGSQPVESDRKLFVSVVEQWKHNRSTIRAPHQLEIHKKKGDYIYCRIVKRKLQKSKYFCIKSVSSIFVSRLTLIILRSGTLSVANIFVNGCQYCIFTNTKGTTEVPRNDV